jgi:hypothetical protein
MKIFKVHSGNHVFSQCFIGIIRSDNNKTSQCNAILHCENGRGNRHLTRRSDETWDQLSKGPFK